MDKFHIDCQFGAPIHLEVENGNITKFIDVGGKFVKKLNEVYKGYDITLFKKEFEERMSPTFYNIRSSSYNRLQHKLFGVISRITATNKQRTQALILKTDYKSFDIKLKELEEEKYNVSKEIVADEKRIKLIHKFNVR